MTDEPVLGESLRDYVWRVMREQGLTQEQVAVATGRPPSNREMFKRLGRGEGITLQTARELAHALGVPVAALLVRMGLSLEDVGAVVAADPRPLSHAELVARARAELSHDEVLAIARERMHEPDLADVDEEEVLHAHEPADPVMVGDREYTGRRRPRLRPAPAPDDGGAPGGATPTTGCAGPAASSSS